MSDRGEYRAIRRTLPSRSQVQLLEPHARLVLLMLKIELPPEGIAIRYPEALAHQLAGLTGLEHETVRMNLEILERHDLLVRDGNLVWLVDQLEDDPFNLGNPKHRKGVQNAISALPREKLVARFIMHYAAWFKINDEWESDAYLWAENRQTIGNKGKRKGTDRRSKGKRLPINELSPARAQSNPTQSNPTATTEPADAGGEGDSDAEADKDVSGGTKPDVKYPHYPKATCDTLYQAYVQYRGPYTYSLFRKETSPLFTTPECEFTIDELVNSIQVFGEHADGLSPEKARWQKPPVWIGDVRRWVRLGKMPLTDANGVTERGRAALGET